MYINYDDYNFTDVKFNRDEINFREDVDSPIINKVYFKKPEGIDNLSSGYEIHKQQVRCEEDCLIQVLTQFLDRPPTEDDAKKCQMVYVQGVHDRYTLAYLGVPLGEVKRIFDGCKYTVTFYPTNNSLSSK